MPQFSDILNRLIDLNFIDPDSLHGCTDEEIQTLMKEQHVKRLPQVYADFLKTMGKNYTGAKDPDGVKVYESLLEMRAKISKYFPEFPVPDGAFVYALYDNTVFYIL